MKILLTGGLGFIGSHIAVELLDSGYEVVIGDNLSNSTLDVLKRIQEISKKTIEFGQVDFSDTAQCEHFFEKFDGIEAIIHLAALKAVNESVNYPEKYYHNNLNSISNLLKSAKQMQIKHLVFSSSCTVYGNPETLPVTELHAVKSASSPYGTTKIIGEQLFEEYSKYGFAKSVILRYFNPIGAHHSTLIGELPLGEPDNLIPIVNEVAAGERPFINVYGTDYNTEDGTAVRDYIHVVDLAKAHLSALNRTMKKDSSVVEYYNIGTGTGYSVMEVLHTFEKVNKLKISHRLTNRREGDIEKIWADPSMAQNILGWEAKHNLDEMLESAWNWKKSLLKRKQEKEQ